MGVNDGHSSLRDGTGISRASVKAGTHWWLLSVVRLNLLVVVWGAASAPNFRTPASEQCGVGGYEIGWVLSAEERALPRDSHADATIIR